MLLPKQRVAWSHHGVDYAVVGEDVHLARRIERGAYFLVACAGCFQHTVALGLLYGVVDKVFNLNVAELLGVAGVRGVAASTLLAEEGLLKGTHMLLDGILGILLHARVDGGVNLKAVGIDVVFGAVGLGVFLDPSEKGILLPGYGIIDVALVFPSAVIGQHGLLGRKYAAELFAEIWCEAVLVVDAVEVEFQRQLL